MNDATAPKVVERQDGAKKPGITGLNWLTPVGALCLVANAFVPQHALAHTALGLLALVLFAVGNYRSYFCPLFALFGIGYILNWLHLSMGKIGLPLLLLAIAVGVIGTVRDRRKSSS